MRLATAAPAAMGVDPAALARTLTELAAQGTELHGIVVLRHGRVIMSGEADPWTPDQIRLVYSLSKTFCSAAVGIAVDQGCFGYEDRVVDLLADQVDDRVGELARQIRVRDLLAMASGHEQDLIMDIGQRGLAEADLGWFLRIEPTGIPGRTFCYNQLCTWTLSRLVARYAGADVLELLTRHVFGPLQVDSGYWARDCDGLPLGFSGLHISTATVAAFFQLLADGGIHHGVRLLPAAWISEHSRTQVETLPAGAAGDPVGDWALGYGWQVWRSRHGYRGDGAFGQYGMVLPEQDLVVAITSWSPDLQVTMDVIWSELLPGVDREPTPGGDQELAQALAGLKVPTAGTGWPEQPATAGWSGSDNHGNHLSLTADADQASLDWTDDTGARHQLVAGPDTWLPGRLAWDERWLAVATSAGYGPDGWRLRMAILHTPHLVTWTLPTGSCQATIAWSEEPLGWQRIHQLAQPFPLDNGI